MRWFFLKSIVYEKAYTFSLNIIKLYKYLHIEKKEYTLSKQVLRSGTSIGANIKEALRGQSQKDFAFKMNIALKEASETEYWLDLLTDSEFINNTLFPTIKNDCKELNRILISIVRTSRNNLND